jgi:hypothetical protein
VIITLHNSNGLVLLTIFANPAKSLNARMTTRHFNQNKKRSKINMEQYFTFDRLSLITSLMRRYAIDAAQAAELANDILG